MRPDRFVAGNQRIPQPGKRRHAAGPQQPLGSGADAGPLDVDDHVRFAGVSQGQSTKHQMLWLLQYDCQSVAVRVHSAEMVGLANHA